MNVRKIGSCLLASLLLCGTAIAGPVAHAPVVAASPRLDVSPAALGQALGQQEWQRQYDTAKTRRKSGLRKVVIGLVMEGGGVAMMMAGSTTCVAKVSVTNDCSGSGAVAATGALVAVAGAVPFWWGVIQWVGANGDVHSLEATKPSGSSAQSINLTDHQAIQLSGGRRPMLAYKVSW